MTPYRLFGNLQPTVLLSLPGEQVPVPIKGRVEKDGGIVYAGRMKVFVRLGDQYYPCTISVRLTGVDSETWGGGPLEIK